ncbi:MAG TPA: hypothetical protein VGI28_01800 [Stellaceae bacterium]|jgi:hypothetical protein
MIQRSISLKRRLEGETVRHVGSQGRLVYYKGEMPERCELQADGERIESVAAHEELVRDLHQGNQPKPQPPATYWRLMDNNGNVVMQGDGL